MCVGRTTVEGASDQQERQQLRRNVVTLSLRTGPVPRRSGAIAPIVEQHRGLPPGHIAVRVLASDRDSNFTTITGGTRREFDDEETLKNHVLRYFA
jgi:hypothetical protein